MLFQYSSPEETTLYQIYCLLVTIYCPATRLHNDLFEAACEMILAGEKSRKIRSDHYEGTVTTENKEGAMGSISGMEFLATISSNEGEGQIKFLIRDSDLASHMGAGWISPSATVH